jgi:hypothetical protein
MKKFLHVTMILFLNIVCIGFAYGQSDIQIYVAGHGGIQPLRAIDNLLDITVPGTLAGIAIIAGNFLVVYKPHEKFTDRIKKAEKQFFRSFYFLLICTVLILVLNIIEIMLPNISEVEIIDIFIKYTLFGIGILYLFMGTKNVMMAITSS